MSRIENDVMGTHVLLNLVKEIMDCAINMKDETTAERIQMVRIWFNRAKPSVQQDVEMFLRHILAGEEEHQTRLVRSAIDIIITK